MGKKITPRQEAAMKKRKAARDSTIILDEMYRTAKEQGRAVKEPFWRKNDRTKNS